MGTIVILHALRRFAIPMLFDAEIELGSKSAACPISRIGFPGLFSPHCLPR
jgi:hypothetical protein